MVAEEGRGTARRPAADDDDASVPRDARQAGPLAELLAGLRQWSHEREALASAVEAGLPRAAEWPALPALDDAQALWSQLRNREQVRQALVPAPLDAGPLNSRALVARMLQLMHLQSPGYLRRFTSYVDVLGGLQDLQVRGAPAAVASGGGAVQRMPRTKPRRRPGSSRSAVDPV